MSAIEINLSVPYVFVKKDISTKVQNRKVMQTLAIPSMVASTIIAAFLVTFLPQFMTLWMSLASRTL